MGRPKKNAKPAVIEPEDESLEMPDDEPEPTAHPAANGKPMTKADACRAALADGIDDAEKAMAFTKSRFGIEIKPTDFTLYKSKAKKQGAKKAEPAKSGRKPRAVENGYLAPPPKPAPVGDQPDLLAAMEAMKPLVAQMGAEKVKRIVDLLG